MRRRLIALALCLGLAGGCAGRAGPAATTESAAAQGATASLVISLSDHDFEQNPQLLQRIVASPHGYFRFISRPFAQAVCRRFENELDILPTVNLHGDAHLENYVVTNRQRGLADFDDASAGPFVLDLVRFGVSIRLASRRLGWGGQSDAMVAAFIEGYRDGLRHGDRAVPDPALVSRIRAGFPSGRREVLAKAEALMVPIGTTGRDFERALTQYRGQMEDEHPELPPGFFDVKAMGTFKLGIGSALSEKYLMRIEGPTDKPGDDLILEAKAVRDLVGIGCVQRPRVEVSRIVIAQARLAFEPPRYVGAAILHPYLGFERRKKFWINAWEDHYAELSISRSFETPGDLFDILRDAGFQLGRGHPKSIADPYEAKLRRALIIAISELETDIIAAIRDLTRQTIAAWEEVRAAAEAAESAARPN